MNYAFGQSACFAVEINGVLVFEIGLDVNFFVSEPGAVFFEFRNEPRADALALVVGADGQVVDVDFRRREINRVENVSRQAADNFFARADGDVENDVLAFEQGLQISDGRHFEIRHFKNFLV